MQDWAAIGCYVGYWRLRLSMDRYRTLAAFRARISTVLSLTATVLAVRRVQGYVTGS